MKQEQMSGCKALLTKLSVQVIDVRITVNNTSFTIYNFVTRLAYNYVCCRTATNLLGNEFIRARVYIYQIEITNACIQRN